MAALRILSLAVAHRRVGSVIIDGENLIDWRISARAAESDDYAAAHLGTLIADFKPDVVVTEEIATARHKGRHSHAIIAALAHRAEESGLLSVSLPREQRFANKYSEAAAITARFPELAPWQPPKRRFYENEPRNTVLFEAVALAMQLMDKG